MARTPASAHSITILKDVLKDKIMGGWAGQTIGVTFGGPTEFRFNGTMIQDYQPIVWYDGYIKHTRKTIQVSMMTSTWTSLLSIFLKKKG